MNLCREKRRHSETVRRVGFTYYELHRDLKVWVRTLTRRRSRVCTSWTESERNGISLLLFPPVVLHFAPASNGGPRTDLPSRECVSLLECPAARSFCPPVKGKDIWSSHTATAWRASSAEECNSAKSSCVFTYLFCTRRSCLHCKHYRWGESIKCQVLNIILVLESFSPQNV